jgi:hypothetical protein
VESRLPDRTLSTWIAKYCVRLAAGLPPRRLSVKVVLGDAGLAQARSRGHERMWELKPQRLVDAQAFLDLVGQRWDGALERLKALVEE